MYIFIVFRLLLTQSGKVYSCGWGADGQTGLGHYNSEQNLKRVLGDIENEKIVKISSKCDCVLAINGRVTLLSIRQIYHIAI